MMLPTHALVGILLALPIALTAPEFASVAIVSGLLGGIGPDLDLYVGHRKTLHYPVYYSVLAVAAVSIAALVPTTATIAATCLLLGAAVHCVMDIFGGGLELRPWETTSERAVYDHHRGRWLPPRRWIRYDGAPEDLLLSIAFAGPLFVVLDGTLRWIVASIVAVAIGYTAVRRILPTIAELLVERLLVRRLPERVLGCIPSRYLPERSS